MVIKWNKDLFSIFKMEHRTPGNLRGFVQVKMRNFKSGTMVEHRFSSEDKVERASLEEHEMEYLYDDGEFFYFMNTETFEQMHLTKDLLGDATYFLIPSIKLAVEFYEGKADRRGTAARGDHDRDGDRARNQGATVSNVTKPAKLETGLVVQVPPFINEGEKIRVSTAEANLPRARVTLPSVPLSSSGKTVRKSSTTLPFSIRATMVFRPQLSLDPHHVAGNREQPSRQRLIGGRAAACNAPSFDNFEQRNLLAQFFGARSNLIRAHP